jgi:hypothetical protein
VTLFGGLRRRRDANASLREDVLRARAVRRQEFLGAAAGAHLSWAREDVHQDHHDEPDDPVQRDKDRDADDAEHPVGAAAARLRPREQVALGAHDGATHLFRLQHLPGSGSRLTFKFPHDRPSYRPRPAPSRRHVRSCEFVCTSPDLPGAAAGEVMSAQFVT